MSVFDRRYETMPRAELEQLQLERLQALLVRLKRNVRRHRERLGDLQVGALADVPRLPLSGPEDMVESFPYGMFAFPLREVIRLNSGVGPAGRPVVIGHTRNDLAQWGRLAARQLVAAGVTANDVIQVALGEGVYPSASGYLLGAELIEASVIAEDPAHTDSQLAMLQNYRPTILVTTPGNAHELVRIIERRHIDPQSLHLRTVLLSRPVESSVREQIGAGLFATVRCGFGVGEVLDPGLCLECEQGALHIHEDHFLPEIVEGELVVTTLTREAMPLLRFRTRIAAELIREKCPCGRTSVMLRPAARLDDRLIVNETPLYPQQIAEVLAQSPLAGRPFEIQILDRHIVLKVEMSPELFSDTIWYIERLQHEVEAEFSTRLGVEARITFFQPPARPAA
jgi:phenylacetate-CoA ligase